MSFSGNISPQYFFVFCSPFVVPLASPDGASSVYTGIHDVRWRWIQGHLSDGCQPFWFYHLLIPHLKSGCSFSIFVASIGPGCLRLNENACHKSAHGGAGSLTTFGKSDFPRIPSKHQPRTLQLPQLRKRLKIGRRETVPFRVPDVGTLSTRNGRDLNIRPANLTPHNGTCVLHHDEGIPTEGNNRRSTSVSLLSAVCPDTNNQPQMVQRRYQQVSSQSFAINHAASLYRSSIYHGSPTLRCLQSSTNSPPGCIDPRVLSKTYIPERDYLTYSPILPELPNYTRESQNSILSAWKLIVRSSTSGLSP